MDDLSEKEQLEQFRTWWSAYGSYVIVGVALGVVGLFGWSYQRTSSAEAEQAASVLYDTLAGYVDDGALEQAEAVVVQITAEYGDTAYATQSKLAMARLYMDNNRDQDAADVLSALLEQRGYPELQHVGRLRLAKVLLYQDQPAEALALLDGEDSAAFGARYAEVRGDAYAALGRYDEARAEYRRALDASQLETALAGSAPSVGTGFIQLKLLDLPFELPDEEPPAPDAGEPAVPGESPAAGADGATAVDEMGEEMAGEPADKVADEMANEIGDEKIGDETTDENAAETLDTAVEPAEPAAGEETAP